MAFLKVGEKVKPKERLYLMEITMPSGMVVCKIGKSSGASSVPRMLQIVESVYQKFRKTPMIYIKRDREVEDVFTKETILHKFFSDYRYDTPHTFSGSTECFTVPLSDMLMAFEAVVDGNTPDFKYELPEPEKEDIPTWMED